MAQFAEPEVSYHELLQHEKYRDYSWATGLQSRMRQERLSESGRPLCPVLRPCFLRPSQLVALNQVGQQFARIISCMQDLAVESPALLSRLRLPPAEKVLAATPPGYTSSNITSRLEANVYNGSLALQGVEACRNGGLAHAEVLADLFLELPIVQEFARQGYRLSKLGGVKDLACALLQTWREFGGRKVPNVAIVEATQQASYDSSEGHLLAALLNRHGIAAQLVSPDRLEY